LAKLAVTEFTQYYKSPSVNWTYVVNWRGNVMQGQKSVDTIYLLWFI
jgi:hypothetical protein